MYCSFDLYFILTIDYNASSWESHIVLFGDIDAMSARRVVTCFVGYGILFKFTFMLLRGFLSLKDSFFRAWWETTSAFLAVKFRKFCS